MFHILTSNPRNNLLLFILINSFLYSWGVVVTNLDDTEEVSKIIPTTKRAVAKKTNVDTMLRKGRNTKTTLDDNAEILMDELEMRFTPLKKRSQITKL